MTYRDLLNQLNALDANQLDSDATLFNRNTGDILEHGQPFIPHD